MPIYLLLHKLNGSDQLIVPVIVSCDQGIANIAGAAGNGEPPVTVIFQNGTALAINKTVKFHLLNIIHYDTQYSPFTMAEARQDVSKMLDEQEEEPRSVRERLRNHQQEQTAFRKKEKDRDR